MMPALIALGFFVFSLCLLWEAMPYIDYFVGKLVDRLLGK